MLTNLGLKVVSTGKTSWRNGSASDSRSEGCVFKSRRGHCFFFRLCTIPSFVIVKKEKNIEKNYVSFICELLMPVYILILFNLYKNKPLDEDGN